MSDTLLNISGKIDSSTVALYTSVSKAADDLDIPFVVVGASARDIVLHHGHGVRVQRATADIDFGIQVQDWAAFDALKASLLDDGFREAKVQHRVISPNNIPVDIVPFGQVEDDESNIAWPPEGDWVMSVLGFQEACDHAEMVRIQDEPPVDIPVATPAGMAVLKLIAWTDRAVDMRRKDAKDLQYLFTTYEKIPAISELLYSEPDVMAFYDWDIELASAYQLGVEAEAITAEQTYNTITRLLNGDDDKLSVEMLVEEMCERIEREYERNESLMKAFINGFIQGE